MRQSVITLGLVALFASSTAAHEKGTISVSPTTVSAGSRLDVRGEDLPTKVAFRVQLRGVLNTYDLSTVRTDTGGRFQVQLTLPAGARPGNYTVLIVALDEEVAARADVTLDAEAPPNAGSMGNMAKMPGHRDMPGMREGPARHASAEMMDVPVASTAIAWITIAIVVLGSVVAGLALLLRSSPRSDCHEGT